MTPGEPLRSFQVQGYKSLRDVKLDLSSQVTLLVGANGSGKSNVVDAFELLGRIIDGQLQKHVLRSGGMHSLLHHASSAADSASQIVLEAWGEEHEGLSNGYRAQLSHGPDDSALVAETTYFHDATKYQFPYDESLGLGRESNLRGKAQTTPRAKFVVEVMEGCRVYHFDDVSDDAPPKRRSDVGDDITLSSDGHNIAAVLARLRRQDVSAYDRIVRTVRSVAPFFEDFVLKEDAGTIALRWRERGLDQVFSAGALSDGTMRFICLAVLLLQDRPPPTVVLDEPELGLHPFAVHQLAGVIRRAARSRKIVAATQSVTLLEQFTVDEVAVVERAGEGTQVSRPDPKELGEWLEDYSLGELWEKNILGGRPTSARS